MITWLELSKVEEGTRIVFPDGFDIFPDCYVKPGTTATVTENSLNEACQIMLVRPDDEVVRTALAEWNGDIHLSPELQGADWHDDSPVEIIS